MRLSLRLPMSMPVIFPGMLLSLTTFWARLCGSNEILICPLLLPYAEFGPKLTYASKLPERVKPRPLMNSALMGGWWLICSP